MEPNQTIPPSSESVLRDIAVADMAEQKPKAPAPSQELPKPPKELPPLPEKLLSSPTHQGNSWGALIGIVIILIVLVIGALYFWGAKLAQEDAQKSAPEAGAGAQN